MGLVLIVAGVMVAFPSLTSTRATNAASTGDWSMYMYNAGRGGDNSNETIINASSAPNLKQHWTYTVEKTIFSQPVEANSLIYWGSFDGYEHATTLGGQQLWSQKLGGYVSQCVPTTLGIVSSVAVVNGVLFELH